MVDRDVLSHTLPFEGVLERIRECQRGRPGRPSFAQALSEIKAGHKQSHWIWYVWPTLRGVRRTMRSDLELPSFEAARAYLRDCGLRDNLVQITEAATERLQAGVSPGVLFGAVSHKDAPKYHEACTLFLLAARAEGLLPEETVFAKGLQVSFIAGAMNPAVLEYLRSEPGIDELISSTLASITTAASRSL